MSTHSLTLANAVLLLALYAPAWRLVAAIILLVLLCWLTRTR
jgi:hypothetical protein